jgi:general secretion pathway protein C
VGPYLPGLLLLPPRAAEACRPAEASQEADGGASADAGAGGAASTAEPEEMAAGTSSDPAPAPSTKRGPRKARHARAGGQLAEELARGIRKLGGRRYEIKRDVLELALRNLRSLSAWARVAPDVRDGKPSGFRVVAVMPRGPFAKLGLRRDDVLVSVNNLDIRTPDRALDAYGKLKSSSRFALGLLRDGREIVLEYAVR